jgi:hypothetical protein
VRDLVFGAGLLLLMLSTEGMPTPERQQTEKYITADISILRPV